MGFSFLSKKDIKINQGIGYIFMAIRNKICIENKLSKEFEKF
jgi:hypothetical protein